MLAVLFLDAVDAGHVGMGKRRQGLGLAVEPGVAIRVAGEGVGQDFQGHVAVEFGVPGPVDFTHATRADLGEDFVMSQGLACFHVYSCIRRRIEFYPVAGKVIWFIMIYNKLGDSPMCLRDILIG